MGYPDLVEGP